MRAKQAGDWAMYSQVAFKYKALCQKAWLVERHTALIRSALQRAESQAIKESLVVSLVIVLGFVTCSCATSGSASTTIPLIKRFPGRQQHLLPPLEGCYYGDLGQKG